MEDWFRDQQFSPVNQCTLFPGQVADLGLTYDLRGSIRAIIETYNFLWVKPKEDLSHFLSLGMKKQSPGYMYQSPYNHKRSPDCRQSQMHGDRAETVKLYLKLTVPIALPVNKTINSSLLFKPVLMGFNTCNQKNILI